MARRFGRNQKRALRDAAKKSAEAEARALADAKAWERQAASDRSALWDLTENVERLVEEIRSLWKRSSGRGASCD